MLKKNVYLVLSFAMLLLIGPGVAESSLTPNQLKRVKVARSLLGSAETSSLQQLTDDITQSPAPEGALQILEAVAKVYRKMANEYEIINPADQQRLLGKIRMNMAYFQLGGPDVERDGEGLLNIVIRRELKATLSPKVFQDRRLFYSLTDQ